MIEVYMNVAISLNCSYSLINRRNTKITVNRTECRRGYKLKLKLNLMIVMVYAGRLTRLYNI
jgi:hypothetical protein